VTFGEPEQQLKAHKQGMRTLASLGHDPTDRVQAMALAREYGRALHAGVYYRDPNPPPTYESQVRERQRSLAASALGRERILDLFVQR
jgi:2-oxoglutarate ferredoxin oxidoreductase subunit beta